jgi:DEAD/DEAH box helicase domain-containing protein
MNIENAIRLITSAPWYRGQITFQYIEQASEPKLFPLPDVIDPAVAKWLLTQNISQLYEHQVLCFNLASEGKDTILCTPTASGKTLAFLLPILQALAKDEDACALLLYPLKALTNDQLEILKQAETQSGLFLSPAVYDGDTPQTKRPKIRQFSRIVLSNPYEIHEILPYHQMWRRFFQNLKFIVIDEAHKYTGVFGSHVAQVIRRLLRVVKHYGADPTFILASASIGNPEDHAFRLTSRKCMVVKGDSARKPKRHIVFMDASKPEYGSPFVQAANLIRTLVSGGLKTLCFTRSRKAAEFIASLLEKEPLVAPYRAGYMPEERRAIEKGFKEGKLLGVVATSALELGIDIGDLDIVVLTGYPGSVSTFWQQIGRAGRKGDSCLGIFMASETIVDQYVLRHPERVLKKEYEVATISLDNPHIVAGHMLCSASELPLSPDAEHEEIALELERKGLLRRSSKGFIYAAITRPHALVKLDAISQKTVVLVDEATNKTLETMDFSRALREAHPGAVYLHQAETYVCQTLDLQGLIAILRRQDVDYYTQSLTQKDISVKDARRLGSNGYVTSYSSQIVVTTRVIGYLCKRYDRLIGRNDLDLPPLTLETKGLFMEFDIPNDYKYLGGLHAIEHTLVALAPLLISCDPSDLAGFSTIQSPYSGLPAIFIYDGQDGGIGLSDELASILQHALSTCLEHLSTCPCKHGCPACCLSPQCGNDNQPMDKGLAMSILRQILESGPIG